MIESMSLASAPDYRFGRSMRVRCLRLHMRVFTILTLLVAIAPFVACNRSAAADADPPTLHIAAASAMRPVMTDLLAQFKTQHPEIRITITVGASGNLYAQIKNRAPFDLFLASDTDYPSALIRDQYAVGPIIRYATGHLVLWVPHDSSLDLNAGLDALRDPALRRLAIATPRHAPYGRAARDLLSTLNLHDQLADRLILGENVEQAAKFAHTGAADAALIPATLARQTAMQTGRSISIPVDICPGVEHSAVILPRGRTNQSAGVFLDFLLTEPARRILEKYGLSQPGEN